MIPNIRSMNQEYLCVQRLLQKNREKKKTSLFCLLKKKKIDTRLGFPVSFVDDITSVIDKNNWNSGSTFNALEMDISTELQRNTKH